MNDWASGIENEGRREKYSVRCKKLQIITIVLVPLGESITSWQDLTRFEDTSNAIKVGSLRKKLRYVVAMKKT